MDIVATVAEQRKVDLVHEKCVLCNCETPYTFADDVSGRDFYIPGHGQYCQHCYNTVIHTKSMPDCADIADAGGVAVLKKVEAPPIMPYNYGENEFYEVELIGEPERKPVYSFVKRAFDIIVSLLALVILALPMLVIAVMVKVTSPGPVLFRQRRVGLNGRQFTILKFRSMCTDAEKAGAKWSDGDNDARITPIGHVLRKFRLDELPQLLCILAGTMSLVGPRPELDVFYREFEKHVHGFSERLRVKPGLTGWAQINGGYDLAPQEKVKKDIEYIRNRSAWLDIKIIIKTVGIVFSHDGAK